MFSLIITIISIALVAVLALATLYYGGSAYARGQLQAQAAKVDIQTQQLMGAAQLFKSVNNRWPQTMNEMVQSNFLKAIPVAQTAIAQALAAQQWTMPVEYQPVFVLEGVSPELCREINLKAYGQRGILASMPTGQMLQCSGPNLAQLQVVVAAGPDALEAAAAAGTAGFTSSALTTETAAAVAAGGSGWLVAPEAATVAPPSNMAVQQVTPVSGTSFASVQTGQAATLDFTLKNTGAGDLTDIQLTADGDAALSVLPGTCDSGAVLEYEESCTFTVRYAPTAVQPLVGSVTVSSSAVNGPSVVQVSGASTGVGALRFLESFDFGLRNFGDTTAFLTRTLENNGTAEVSGLAFSFANMGAADVFATQSNCPTTLQPGETCEVTTSFVPLVAAQVNYGLNAVAGDINVQGVLRGSGAQLGATTTSVANGGTSVVEFSNLRGSEVVTSMALYSGQTEVARSTSVSHSAGATSGSATFASVPNAGTLSLALFDSQGRRRATGSVTVLSALVTQTTGSGALGAGAVGATKTATITFQASGTKALTGVSVVKSGDSAFALSSTTCASSLSAGQSCNAVVSFTPASAGTNYTGALTFNSSATNGPLVVPLTGRGAEVQTINYSGNIVAYTAPAAGTYTFEVAGAQGGAAGALASNGGRGARITCTVTLQADDQLKLLVGGRGGGNNTGGVYGGGGGGSFVTRANDTPLCIAGGGGGDSVSGGSTSNAKGLSGTGSGGAANGGVAGGGGLTANGTGGANNTGGRSFIAPGNGAQAFAPSHRPTVEGYGGFGGGASSNRSTGDNGSGGGYTGGTGASGAGGGGTSYSVSGAGNTVVVLGQHTGDGYIKILAP